MPGFVRNVDIDMLYITTQNNKTKQAATQNTNNHFTFGQVRFYLKLGILESCADNFVCLLRFCSFVNLYIIVFWRETDHCVLLRETHFCRQLPIFRHFSSLFDKVLQGLTASLVVHYL